MLRNSLLVRILPVTRFNSFVLTVQIKSCELTMCAPCLLVIFKCSVAKCVQTRRRGIFMAFTQNVLDLGLDPALQLTGDHRLHHHNNGSCHHINQLDNTHARSSLLPSHTIPCSPSACLSTPHFSCNISPPYCSLEGRATE